MRTALRFGTTSLHRSFVARRPFARPWSLEAFSRRPQRPNAHSQLRARSTGHRLRGLRKSPWAGPVSPPAVSCPAWRLPLGLSFNGRNSEDARVRRPVVCKLAKQLCAFSQHYPRIVLYCSAAEVSTSAHCRNCCLNWHCYDCSLNKYRLRCPPQ